MRIPAQYVGPDYEADDLSLMWGLPQATVVDWIKSGAIGRNPYGQVTRAALMVFINSEQGQTLLAEARTA